MFVWPIHIINVDISYIKNKNQDIKNMILKKCIIKLRKNAITQRIDEIVHFYTLVSSIFNMQNKILYLFYGRLNVFGCSVQF